METAMQEQRFRAMGCHMLAVLDNESQLAASVLKPVPAWFEEWEQQLSRFRSDSALSLLNQHSGEPQQVSDTLWDVLQATLAAARQSEGLVNPVVLDALEAAGYDHSFDTRERDGDNKGHAVPRVASQNMPIRMAWEAIETDPHTRTVYLPTGMRLDLGGIAKGWAAEQVVNRLRQFGPVLVDAGGDIAISGLMESGKRWPIGVTNPFAPDEQLELLMIAGGGVATSGRDYRRWQQDGTWQHHIIDPRTNRPAQTDLVSVTIVAPSVQVAETAAKMVLILGSREGLEWLEAQPSLAGLLVCEDEQVIRSRHLKHVVW